MTDKNAAPTKLLWLDLEMTGLDPDRDRIIEVGIIITDWDFKEIASFETPIRQSAKKLSLMDDWNQQQHQNSGLLAKLSDGLTEKQAEQKLLELIDKHCENPVILAGNSIHHDRRFIRRYWPQFEKRLHYRMLDVSAWKVVMIGKYGHEFKKPETHRALDDIRGSIEELKNYLKEFHKER